MNHCSKLSIGVIATLLALSSWAAEDISITPAPGAGVTIHSEAGTPAIKVLPGQQVQLPGLATDSNAYSHPVCQDGTGTLGQCDTAVLGTPGPAGPQGETGPAGTSNVTASLDCTNTFTAQNVSANSTFDHAIPSCSAGYTLTGAGCRTPGFNEANWAINGLFQASPSNVMAYCAGVNLTAGTIRVEGTAQCCRVVISQ